MDEKMSAGDIKSYRRGLKKALELLKSMQRWELEWEWMTTYQTGTYLKYEDIEQAILTELKRGQDG